MSGAPKIPPLAQPAPIPPVDSAWRRFRRRRSAAWGTYLFITLSLISFLSLPWTREAARRQDLASNRAAPSAAHLFGTDELGRDLLARTLYGGAVSLALGLVAAGVAVGLGVTYGAVAGYAGGAVDEVMMRAVDILYALPYMLLVMLLTVSLGGWLNAAGLPGGSARLLVLALAIGGVSWLTMARVVRGQVLSLRERAFVEAARTLGLPPGRILWRHVLPNLVGPVIVFATLTVPQAILQESFLSFLGVGVMPPQATWGSLAADGVRLLNPVQVHWWLVVFPCAALGLTLLALNFIGDGLRDALDVRGRG